MDYHTSPAARAPTKAPTGIDGFDEITGGGLPRGRTTLLKGGPGSGKTVFALKFLVDGWRESAEPGVFVAFEETSTRIVANAEGFGWDLVELQERGLYFVDVQPPPDLIQSGDFDLRGMLAALEARVLQVKARRIVFDSLDVMLALLPDNVARKREVYRLHDWLLARELTAIVTAKAGDDEQFPTTQQFFRFMQFMVDCTVILNHNVQMGVSQRSVRVQKFRGSGFDENERPFLIGKSGLEVSVARTLIRADVRVSNERVSSGVEPLDTMLGGGYYRGASVLITGLPGTAKTTLAGAFAEAACGREERTLFMSFDADGSEVTRNLGSVGIRLDRYVSNGLLRIIPAGSISGGAENYLMRIKTLASEHATRCLVIDPISILSRSGNDLAARDAAERLIGWAKANGITLVCTNLFEEMSSRIEGSSRLQVSAVADTWIHLDYLVHAGERNRVISIIKSRGTAHSNQVRELILTDAGVTLTDTYMADGKVLLGTLRWEKESGDRAANEVAEVAGKLKRVRLDAEEAELEVRVKSLQTELVVKQLEKALLTSTTEIREREVSRGLTRMHEWRGAGAAHPGAGSEPT